MAGTFRVAGGEVTLPNGLITDATIASNAAIQSSKMKHIYKAGTNFGFQSTGTPSGLVEHIVHVTSGTGRIINFNCLLVDTGTSTSVSFDLLVNGVSVLSSAVGITEADADGVVVQGTVLTDTLTVDDIITIEMNVSSATGAYGPYAWVDIEEDNAPN